MLPDRLLDTLGKMTTLLLPLKLLIISFAVLHCSYGAHFTKVLLQKAAVEKVSPCNRHTGLAVNGCTRSVNARPVLPLHTHAGC